MFVLLTNYFLGELAIFGLLLLACWPPCCYLACRACLGRGQCVGSGLKGITATWASVEKHTTPDEVRKLYT